MRIFNRHGRFILIPCSLLVLLYYFRIERNKKCIDSYTDDSILVSMPVKSFMSGGPVHFTLPQNHQSIIDFIWENGFIEPPSNKSYSITKMSKNPSKGQGQFIQRIFRNMTNGFFIECGALDGETRSNSLWLEMHLGWKGLLVEGDPINYELIKKKNRKAWISRTCLATKPYPHQAEFAQNFNLGKILDQKTSNKSRTKKVKVQCMPIFSLLAALNVTTVDYFSLDVEGSELKVLKTIPFDVIHIKSLSVEFFHTVEGKQSLLTFMESTGYKMVGEVRDRQQLANDFMFVHKNDVNSLDI